MGPPGGPRGENFYVIFFGIFCLNIFLPHFCDVLHPGISKRRFVLQPLCDLNPTLRIPGIENDVSGLLGFCSEEPKIKLWDPTHT